MEDAVKPGVAAAIVTHRRPAELRRLIQNLSDSGIPLLGCVISDHAPDGETREIAKGAGLPVIVLEDASNPGPGAGWANAARRAMEEYGSRLQAIWYLDDDVLIPANALEILWREMTAAKADAIAPLLEDSKGDVWGFPEPEPAGLRKVIREARKPADAVRLLGTKGIPFCWCTGACFLVKTEAIGAVGLHRTDFWMLGEDLEYSMRIASSRRAVFTCAISVPHLPGEAQAAPGAEARGRIKFCSLLQNLSYLSFHSPDSAHMKFYLAGNFRRFFRTYGWNGRALGDAWSCFRNGALRGEPAGKKTGLKLREAISSRGNSHSPRG